MYVWLHMLSFFCGADCDCGHADSRGQTINGTKWIIAMTLAHNKCALDQPYTYFSAHDFPSRHKQWQTMTYAMVSYSRPTQGWGGLEVCMFDE